MAKEALNAVVFAAEETYDMDPVYGDRVTIRGRHACADRVVHVFVQDVLRDWYEYEVDESGPHTIAQGQELTSRTFWYGPCNGTCQTEKFAEGEVLKIDERVVAEIPEQINGWQRAHYYYRRRF